MKKQLLKRKWNIYLSFLIGLLIGIAVMLPSFLKYHGFQSPVIIRGFIYDKPVRVTSPLPDKKPSPTPEAKTAPNSVEAKTPVLVEVASKPLLEQTERESNLSGVEQWRSLVAKYFPADQIDYALAIMKCESGGNPTAVSSTNDHGLFQINGGLQNHGSVIYDPEYNVALAYNSYYKTRGWQPWYCRFKV